MNDVFTAAAMFCLCSIAVSILSIAVSLTRIADKYCEKRQQDATTKTIQKKGVNND